MGDKTPTNVDALHKDGQREHHHYKPRDTKRERPRNQHKKTCGNCDRSHEPKQCPAYGKTCNSCDKSGHFAKLCRSSKNRPSYTHNSHIQHLEVDGNTSDHGIDEVQGDTNASTNEHATLKINKPVRLKLDSGAETNILTKSDFQKVVPKRQRHHKLQTSLAKLTAFGGHPISVIGKCYLRCTHKSSTQARHNCKTMELITFNNIEQITSETSSLSGLSSEQIFTKYSHCFERLGRISEPYHNKVDPTVIPLGIPPFTPLGNYLHRSETEFIASYRIWKRKE